MHLPNAPLILLENMHRVGCTYAKQRYKLTFLFHSYLMSYLNLFELLVEGSVIAPSTVADTPQLRHMVPNA